MKNVVFILFSLIIVCLAACTAEQVITLSPTDTPVSAPLSPSPNLPPIVEPSISAAVEIVEAPPPTYPPEPTKSPEPFQPPIAEPITDRYAAYYQIITEMTAQYGEAKLIRKASDSGTPDDVVNEYQDALYFSGVCLVDLMDFNGDGLLDLLVIYSNGKNTGKNISGVPIPQAGTYHIGVWTVCDGVVERILNVPFVSSYQSFYSTFWDSDCCFITVYENKAELPIIQIHSESRTGCKYTNIYFSGGVFVRDELFCGEKSFLMNGEKITANMWDEQISGYNKIILCAELSRDNVFSVCDDTMRDDILTLTKQVVDALSRSQVMKRPYVESYYLAPYLKEINRVNRERWDLGPEYFYYPYKYALCDIDRNGIPELIIKTGVCEADYMYEIYTISGNSAIRCGEIAGGHTILSYGIDSKGLVCYEAHMGSYTVVLLTLDGMTLNAKEITEGYVTNDDFNAGNGYPELTELGYGEYSHQLSFCDATIPILLY